MCGGKDRASVAATKGMIAWHVSQSKTASTKFPTGSSSYLSLHTERAHLAAARLLQSENDKDAVVALREIAEKTISTSDMRERFIHSIQEQVEIDEPEAVAAPLVAQELRPILGRDNQTIDAIVDLMTEEELLRGLQKLSPEDPSTKP